MSDAVIVTVAKEVTSLLSAASFSQAIVPERSYADWELPLESEGMHVDVVGVTTTQKAELAARGTQKYGVQVVIAVRNKFASSDQDPDTGRISLDAVDALVLLVQEIYLFFTELNLPTFTAATWESTSILILPDRKHLKDNRQFTGVVQIAFTAYDGF